MARVNWQGTEIEAELVSQNPDGSYRMRSKWHAPRIEPGTLIDVKQSEIVGLSIGGVAFNGPGAPPQAPQPEPRIITGAEIRAAAGSMPLPQSGPTGANPLPLQQGRSGLGSMFISSTSNEAAKRDTPPSRTPMTLAKTPKLNSLMDGFNSMIAAVEDSADAVHKKFASINDQAKTSTAKLSQAADPIIAMVKQIDDTANQLTNGAPPGPLPDSTT